MGGGGGGGGGCTLFRCLWSCGGVFLVSGWKKKSLDN